MSKITIEISEKREKEYIHTLRKRYNRPRSGLRNLMSMAVREIVEMETKKPSLPRYSPMQVVDDQ